MLLKRTLIAGLLCFGVAACDSAGNPSNVGNAGCSQIDYRNGVYYFPCVEDKFGNALSRFKGDHTDLRVTAIASNGTGPYGVNIGYFISTERK